ncbi:hypothetical protein BHYA_0171g00030 [Botrytis hyacinthi]|uniref:Uncharacterized protein n=1 Tax=Botrytis hyacinthi TaxID=278943 RepID=A0A4Z1GN41_9HELO|nr:hypothetical protein BHYA_0171g00030 [Botrytis hyacinthi]
MEIDPSAEFVGNALASSEISRLRQSSPYSHQKSVPEEYPGHLPTRGGSCAPTRGYLEKKLLTLEERRARASELGSQIVGQGRQSLPHGQPALNFGEQGLLKRSVQLPYGLPDLKFGVQGIQQGGQSLPTGPHLQHSGHKVPRTKILEIQEVLQTNSDLDHSIC